MSLKHSKTLPRRLAMLRNELSAWIVGDVLDLPRFDGALLSAFIATKETDYGTKQDG